MTSAARFAVVDWGTSGFRLWLVDGDGTVLARRKSRQGMIVAAETGFANVLEEHLGALGAPGDLPVVICGMAGARQGWVEAGYADVPTGLSGLAEKAVRVPGIARDVRILPGLAQRIASQADVMRGEETQLLGAQSAMDHSRHLVCMPGTHSKWVAVEDGIVKGFSTYMTGELFAAISDSTILQHAIKGADGFDENGTAFADAVLAAHDQPGRATSQLFSIRARGLLLGAGAADSLASLSGTMIGLELAGALPPDSQQVQSIILVAEGRLARLYMAALARLDIHPPLVDADAAVLGGLCQAARTLWPRP